MEQKAEKFAMKAHKGQLRKDGVTPYVKHCEGVVALLKVIGIIDEDIICAAWLHDTIEDCGITKEQLEKEFNSNIARIVSQLTRDVDREAYKKRIKCSDYSVKIIKLADTVHNCSEMNNLRVPKKTVDTKIRDCEEFYFDLAREICPVFYRMLKKYVSVCADSIRKNH